MNRQPDTNCHIANLGRCFTSCLVLEEHFRKQQFEIEALEDVSTFIKEGVGHLWVVDPIGLHVGYWG